MPKTVVSYFSFIIASLGIVATFITTTTYAQLAIGILLYPLVVYFAYRMFIKKSKTSPSKKEETPIPSPAQPAENSEIAKIEHIGISDIDKRVFLKLIGSAGLLLFLYSIFNKKAESQFFRSLPGPGTGKVSLIDSAGKTIDPAQNQPMDGYSISEFEDNAISFYGFTNKDAAWVVMKVDTDTGSFRYARGDSNFPANWTNRENLKYDYFGHVF